MEQRNRRSVFTRDATLLLVILLCIAGCHRPQPGDMQDRVRIAGCWKGRQLGAADRPFSEYALFALRADSALLLSMTYEIGPRSRVRTPDAEVDVRNGVVRWEDHEGVFRSSKDTMDVVRKEAGGNSRWVFVRDRSADSSMMRLRNYSAGPYAYAMPQARSDGWQPASMSAAGIDGSKIIELMDEIRDGDHGDIHSVLIIRNNKLVLEEYFADEGRKHGPVIADLFRDKPHHLASTTKGVTSALVGIAIDQGRIRSVEDPIFHYLPEYASLFDEGKKRIRIRDMLTMTPGFEWRQFGVSDDSNDGMRMWHTDDVIRFVLQKPLEAEPGTKFNYTNGVPTVTGAIIKNAVGADVSEFAEKFLFQPLEILEYVWSSYPDGSIETDGGLALKPRDLAKIGQLFLDNGVWHGRRIVSENWVRESTRERLRWGRFNRWGYGYHWMQAESRIGNRVLRSWFVPGDGNQILAVFPDLQLVVVCTAGNYGMDPKPVYYALFEEFILPAALSGGQ